MMWPHDSMGATKLSIYLYVEKTPTWLVRVVYIFGIFSWLLVVYGYTSLIVTDPLYWWILFPALFFFTAYYLTSYSINLWYKQFDVREHIRILRRFWRKKITPSVDIFLPICGEDTEVLAQTFLAVKNLRYKNKTVYVLDDKGIEEHKQLALAHKFIYLSRENKGVMKKAGNIKHGYERSTGDFIAIFDADFAPHPYFIKHLLPYMNDPKVAIIQTPQFFPTDRTVHDRSSLEYGAGHVQQDFYRFIQVSRSRLGAPICCGSNAIYRRAALDMIGGTTQIEHSEDMHTGFDLTNIGWHVKYVPLVLAIGICPSSMHQYFHQQHRWCSGSLSLMLDKKFWCSKQLNLGQRLCFISGFMYYMSYPVSVIISFQVFIVLLRHDTTVHLQDSLAFIPCFVFSFIIMPLFRIGTPRIGNLIARTANGYAYCHAVVSSFIKKSVDWQPTNVKKMKISKAFHDLVIFNALYVFVYIAFVGLVIHRRQLEIFNINYSLVLFWLIFNVSVNCLILYKFYLVFDGGKVDQYSLGTLSRPRLTMWRLQTAGTYVLSVIFILALTIRYGTF